MLFRSLHGQDADVFTANMYLAEDRILCFEIVTKKKEGWTLKYVKSAKASTDVPSTVPEFISQRRRWLNGSLFASIHATVFWFRIWTSGQNFFRKIILTVEFIYNAIQLIFTWTSLANFYLAFFFVSISFWFLCFRLTDMCSWYHRQRQIRAAMHSTSSARMLVG